MTAASSYFVELMDYFQDDTNTYMVRKHYSKTMRSVVTKLANPLLPEK